MKRIRPPAPSLKIKHGQFWVNFVTCKSFFQLRERLLFTLAWIETVSHLKENNNSPCMSWRPVKKYLQFYILLLRKLRDTTLNTIFLSKNVTKILHKDPSLQMWILFILTECTNLFILHQVELNFMYFLISLRTQS